jgi:hypothetical protein
MPPPTSSIAEIDTALSEISDYEVTATVVGPDGVTPVQPAAASTLTATLISLEPGEGVIFANRDAISYLGADGAFVMPIPYSDLTLTGTARMQKRLLTLKLVQTNGKRRTQGVKFSVENIPGA